MGELILLTMVKLSSRYVTDWMILTLGSAVGPGHRSAINVQSQDVYIILSQIKKTSWTFYSL